MSCYCKEKKKKINIDGIKNLNSELFTAKLSNCFPGNDNNNTCTSTCSHFLHLASNESLPNGHFLGLGTSDPSSTKSGILMNQCTIKSISFTIRDHPNTETHNAKIYVNNVFTGIKVTQDVGTSFKKETILGLNLNDGDILSVQIDSDDHNTALANGAAVTIEYIIT